MLAVVKGGVGLIELYQHVLRHVVCVRLAAQIAVGHAEDGVHILLHRLSKLFICHRNGLLEKLFTSITRRERETFQKKIKGGNPPP